MEKRACPLNFPAFQGNTVGMLQYEGNECLGEQSEFIQLDVDKAN